MSFLTPLYIAGLLAVSLPVLFHLIRRSPRGRTAFSSLMFLQSSPPRLTRKSRIEHLLLLLLRAAALALLAAAFARPFLRQMAQIPLEKPPLRRVAILVDASASMQRGDLWRQAQQRLRQVLSEIEPTDQAALFTFDRKVQSLIGFSESAQAPPDQRAALFSNRLGQAAPTWSHGDLGAALLYASDLLEGSARPSTGAQQTTEPDPKPEQAAVQHAADPAPDTVLQIIVISDMQRGGRLHALQAYKWPDQVQVNLEVVSLVESANAGLHLAREIRAIDPTTVRVRINHGAQSSSGGPSSGGRGANEEFALYWSGTATNGDARRGPKQQREVLRVHVPPGESRIVRVPISSRTDHDRLVMTGDDHDYDNTVFITPRSATEVRVHYFGDESASDQQQLRYFLEKALSDAPLKKITLVAESSAGSSAAADDHSPLWIVGKSPSESQWLRIERQLQNGGNVLIVLKDAEMAAAMAERLAQAGLLVDLIQRRGANDLQTPDNQNRDNRRFALLADIDFRHPIFAPFAQPQYADFTKIRFWRHRVVRPAEEAGPIKFGDQQVRVLARFDDGDPALVELPRPPGRLLVLTSGWHPQDSQLALSSKFVPLLTTIMETPSQQIQWKTDYVIGDRIPIPRPLLAGRRPAEVDAQYVFGPEVQLPTGEMVGLPQDAKVFEGALSPGIYQIFPYGVAAGGPEGQAQTQPAGAEEFVFTVNVAEQESEMATLDSAELEQRGVPLQDRLTNAELQERARQMRDVELERRQRLWKWAIAAALAVLLIETAVSGRLARKASLATST